MYRVFEVAILAGPLFCKRRVTLVGVAPGASADGINVKFVSDKSATPDAPPPRPA